MGDETKTMTEVDAVTEKAEGKAEETASVEEKADCAMAFTPEGTVTPVRALHPEKQPYGMV